MVTDTVQEPHLKKVLTWKDGFAIALVIPNGLFATFGFLIGVIGAWTAIAIWVVATIVGLLQNVIISELAAMFPNKSGGIARYAMEGWRKYFAPVGAISAFGYWMGWSLAISVGSSAFGSLIQAEWFPNATGTVSFLGKELGLAQMIGIVAIIAAWLINRVGIHISSQVNKVIGTFVLFGLAIVAFGPYVVGNANWDIHNLTWHVTGDWKTLVVIFYVTAWTTYGTEICATFAPEYRDTIRDTRKALMFSGIFMLGLFFLVPLGVAGSIGEEAIATNPVGYIATAMESILGGAAWIGVLVVAASLFVAMVSCTADGARALYGLAQEGVTIKQFDYLNKYGVPSRSLAVDAILNIAILVLLGTPVSILLASNLGYLSAITLGISAFILLRKDRPDLHRPIKLSNVWVYVAWVLVAFNVFVIVIGMMYPSLAGYGGARETVIGTSVLLLGVLMFVYRQVVQDKRQIQWRMPHDDEPTQPHSTSAKA